MQLYTHYSTESHQEAAANWRENHLGDSLFYSCRSTHYDRAGYPSTLHYHDYYELVVFLEGDIRYLCEHETVCPNPGDIILIPPGRMHMSMLACEQTLYRRHVFYLYPDAFAPFCAEMLTDFLTCVDGVHLTLAPTERAELLALLDRLDLALSAGEETRERGLAIGLVLQIFYLLGKARAVSSPDPSGLPDAVMEIRRYLDDHFTEISTVAEAAEQLYYSREHIARLFRRRLNTTVSDYIRTRRVAYSRSLIAEGVPLSEVCFRAGFGSLSAFNRAFRAVSGVTPSRYRASLPQLSAEK
ncbi:MAG: helix-turn-helix domain-containing protein [Clostridia bacterium]|nr:helix-turn-helix domain-containing protein [Clostridia bacterium]